MLPYKLLSQETPFNGRRCKITIDRVETHFDASKVHDFEVCHVKDVIAVVLVDKDTNKVVLNENTRYPVGERFLELIAGQIEAGQSPEDACRAESEQEGGYTLDRITPLGEYFTSPGLLTEKCTISSPTEVSTGTKALEEMEDLENKQFDAQEIAGLLADGKIRDLKTAYALSVFLIGATKVL